MNPQTFPVPFPTRSLRDWRTSHHAVQTVSPNQLTLLDLQLKPTTTRLTCAHEPRTFHRFKDAPAEIRLLVWQMARSSPFHTRLWIVLMGLRSSSTQDLKQQWKSF